MALESGCLGVGYMLIVINIEGDAWMSSSRRTDGKDRRLERARREIIAVAAPSPSGELISGVVPGIVSVSASQSSRVVSYTPSSAQISASFALLGLTSGHLSLQSFTPHHVSEPSFDFTGIPCNPAIRSLLERASQYHRGW